MYLTKKKKLKALKKALQYLLEENYAFGLCNIIPTYAQPDNHEDAIVMREIMFRRRSKVKNFYNFKGKVVQKQNQFQWLINDKISRINWLENEIKLLTK